MSLSHPPESDSRGAPHVAPGGIRPGTGDIVAPAISEQIVGLYLESFGRGPDRSRTYVQPQFAVCVLRDLLTPAEQLLILGGDSAEVEAARGRINEAIDAEFVSIVELETGRPVLSHLARTRVSVDIAVHFFLFDDVSPARDVVAR
jgi:uncharacterized protein YbcI